jgi:hypothetical protein
MDFKSWFIRGMDLLEYTADVRARTVLSDDVDSFERLDIEVEIPDARHCDDPEHLYEDYIAPAFVHLAREVGEIDDAECMLLQSQVSGPGHHVCNFTSWKLPVRCTAVYDIHRQAIIINLELLIRERQYD